MTLHISNINPYTGEKVPGLEAPIPVAGGGRPKGKDPYRLKDGTRVPGVTTITGRFKAAEGLMFWAWQCGRDGKDYRNERDAAATAGSIAHGLIEAAIHNRQPTPVDAPDSVLEGARQGYEGFAEWRAQTKVEIKATELPLVSEQYRFGGTLDALGTINGAIALLDWKSSNHIYPEYLAQIGGYVLLANEHGHGPVERVHLLRVGKDDGSFHHHVWRGATLEQATKAFLVMRELYDWMAALKRAVG
jgi:hypothetical protein